jgi:hypothetical protein
MHKDCYFHSLINSKDNLVGHVVVLIFRGICPQESGGRILADGSQSAQIHYDNCGRVGHLHERCFDLYLKLISGCGGGRGEQFKEVMVVKVVKMVGVVEVHQRLGHLLRPLLPLR